MKMIPILLFLSDFWLGIINQKNVRHLKKKRSEELMSIARGILKYGEAFACRKMKKKIDFY